MQSQSSPQKTYLILLLSTLASLLLTPLVLSVTLIIYVIRLTLSFYLHFKYSSNKVTLIEAMDSFQVHDKEHNLLQTFTLLVLEGKCDVDRIRAVISTRVLNQGDNLYGKLRCRIVEKFGFYCWQDVGSDFKVENHIKLLDPLSTCTSNNNSCAWTEHKVLSKLGELYDNKMDIDKPRWEVLIVPNFIHGDIEEKPHYALIFRFHHSILDGISTYLLITRGLAEHFSVPVIDPLKPLGIPFHYKLLCYLKLLLLWPKLLHENTVQVAPEGNCFHGPELTSKKIVRWTKLFRIETLKNIRKFGGFSTNAVLNSAVGGAFKKLAESKGRQVPLRITAVTSIPMLPYPDLKPRNRFSGAFFPLEVNTSRIERLECTHNTLRDINNSPLILMNSLLLRFIGILPAKWSRNMTDSRELTCLTSNVPGPLNELVFFGGDKLAGVTGFLPIKNKTGFGFCFASYCGNIRASIVADGGIVSEQDVEVLRDALENEITEMQNEVGNYSGALEEHAVFMV